MLHKVFIFSIFFTLGHAGYESKTPGLGAYAKHTIAKYAKRPGQLPSRIPTNKIKFPQKYYPLEYTSTYVQSTASPYRDNFQSEVQNYPQTPSQYQYGYTVNDPHSGDSKNIQETRDGDMVRGFYSLIDADGTKRIVEYTADSKNGFNAVVRREPLQHF
ncbi:unnamed protein product [Brassicogethes aeneus]|uniref:Uncharacterized protein n=1 Tax=Brassicogethes aeneus TaxID=1431903 RepID=A0A9P0AZN7_BRAAE|nr:unnamed protein product [Brassicogethes aeneus]